MKSIDIKLQELLIKAKRDVFGGNLGDNLTTFKGDGLDFREIKEYEIGDDIRKINWNATAKTSKTQVNLFNVDRELNIVIVFAISGSIYFGTKILKQDIVASIMAHLAYSTVKNNNKLSGILYSNTEQQFYPPTKNESLIYTITKDILKTNCLHKQTVYTDMCDYINSIVKEKSLIFIVGDFYGEIDLSSIAYKHEVYTLIVRDRFEEYPYISGEYNFVSPVDFSSTNVNMNKSFALKYQKLIKEQDDKFFEHCNQHKIVSGKIYTDDDIYLRLSEILRG